MAEPDQLVAWYGFIALILVARLLLTRRAQVFLGPHLNRLAEWWMARRRASEVDHEYDELALVLRRQELSAHVARLRRIVATDESMSATRQIANRLAYRGLLRDLEETRDIRAIGPSNHSGEAHVALGLNLVAPCLRRVIWLTSRHD